MCTYLKAMWSPVNIVTEEEERGRCEDRPHPPQHLLKANKVLEIAVKVTCACACVCIVLLHRERDRVQGKSHLQAHLFTLLTKYVNWCLHLHQTCLCYKLVLHTSAQTEEGCGHSLLLNSAPCKGCLLFIEARFLG